MLSYHMVCGARETEFIFILEPIPSTGALILVFMTSLPLYTVAVGIRFNHRTLGEPLDPQLFPHSFLANDLNGAFHVIFIGNWPWSTLS